MKETAALKHTYKKTVLLVVGILFVAANLRPSLTAVGPVLGFIREDLGISHSVAGLISTLPLLAFFVFSPLIPRLSSKFGMERTLFFSLLFLTAGILIRSYSSIFTLFLGTFIIGMAIAAGNVLLPGLIKRDFPHQVGVMTGGYSLSMNTFAALGSGLSVPLSRALDYEWQKSLMFWALLSLIALFIWQPQLRHTTMNHLPTYKDRRKNQLWKSKLAWQVTIFMGFQSFVFYISINWLPDVFQDRGMSAEVSGWMVSIMQFIGMPATFIVPILAERFSRQRLLSTIVCLIGIIGYAGLLMGNTDYTILWVLLIGISQGATFGLALTLISLRAKTDYMAARLSGMAQSIGYLFAAFGPFLFGLMHDLTGHWYVSLFLLVAATAIQLLSGLGAGQNSYVLEEDTASS
ncbi:MAG: MFS transporter [Bacillales bacterium]|nr:MFS transporter [Bacillales bacterium]